MLEIWDCFLGKYDRRMCEESCCCCFLWSENGGGRLLTWGWGVWWGSVDGEGFAGDKEEGM